jgi:hypothetical protein
MEEQDIQLILEMLKEIKADRKADKEQMETNLKKDKEDLMAKLDVYQAKTDAVLLAMQVMGISHREVVPEATPGTNIETIACQEMEARLDEEKPTSVDRKPEAADEEEVPVQDAIVEPVKGRKKRYRGKKQAAE